MYCKWLASHIWISLSQVCTLFIMQKKQLRKSYFFILILLKSTERDTWFNTRVILHLMSMSLFLYSTGRKNTYLSWLVCRPPRNKALNRHQTNCCGDNILTSAMKILSLILLFHYKHGKTKQCTTNPVRPSIVSSIGNTWILLPYLTSGHAWTLWQKKENEYYGEEKCDVTLSW